MIATLTVHRLKELFDYDPTTGSWRRNKSRPGVPLSRPVGKLDRDGYRVIMIDKRCYRACRLAFLYMTGEWPKHSADHKDCNPSNDKWSNLRDATRSQQECNKRASGAINFKGVDFHKGRYRARIGRTRTLIGYFNTPELAHAAYAEAANRLHGEFARVA